MVKQVTEEAEDDAVLTSYERGEWRSVAKVREEIARYQAYAAVMLETNREVSVTLPLTDFEKVQQKASEVGMPYQALIADIVHRFVTGNMTEQLSAPQRS
jgi:predicted DNA binding CopG/RHH family protein